MESVSIWLKCRVTQNRKVSLKHSLSAGITSFMSWGQLLTPPPPAAIIRLVASSHYKLDALLRVPRQSLYWEALAILQLSLLMFCIWSRAKFNRIDVLKLFCLRLHFLEWSNSLLLVHGPLARKMSQDRYVRLRTFQFLAFAIVVVCLFVCLCFFHFSNKRDIWNFWIMAVRDIELPWAL